MKEGSFVSTREFLLRVVQVCLEFINESNDRSTKVLRFMQPHELKKKFDFEIGPSPRNLESTIQDCASALYYQVRTGECTQISISGLGPTKAIEVTIAGRPFLLVQMNVIILYEYWFESIFLCAQINVKLSNKVAVDFVLIGGQWSEN